MCVCGVIYECSECFRLSLARRELGGPPCGPRRLPRSVESVVVSVRRWSPSSCLRPSIAMISVWFFCKSHARGLCCLTSCSSGDSNPISHSTSRPLGRQPPHYFHCSFFVELRRRWNKIAAEGSNKFRSTWGLQLTVVSFWFTHTLVSHSLILLKDL